MNFSIYEIITIKNNFARFCPWKFIKVSNFHFIWCYFCLILGKSFIARAIEQFFLSIRCPLLVRKTLQLSLFYSRGIWKSSKGSTLNFFYFYQIVNFWTSNICRSDEFKGHLLQPFRKEWISSYNGFWRNIGFILEIHFLDWKIDCKGKRGFRSRSIRISYTFYWVPYSWLMSTLICRPHWQQGSPFCFCRS